MVNFPMLESHSTLLPEKVLLSWSDPKLTKMHSSNSTVSVDNGLGGRNEPIFGSQRGEQIADLFLPTEQNCAKCWLKTLEFLTVEELSCLEPDIVIRTFRAHIPKGKGQLSNYELERIAEKLSVILSKRVRWFKDFCVKDILDFQDTNSVVLQSKLGITLTDMEQFRYQVIPLKMYGTSDSVASCTFSERRPSESSLTLSQQHILIKLRLKETKWFKARNMFHVFSSKELPKKEVTSRKFPRSCEERDAKVLYLTTLLFEAILRRLKHRNCRSFCSDPNVYITGQFILVVDLEGLSLQYVKNFLFIDIRRFVKKLSKFYPQVVKKVYLVNSPFAVKVMKFLKFLFGTDSSFHSFLNNIVACKDEKTLLELLSKTEKFKFPLLPVEYGGNYDGIYVLDLQATD